MSNKMPSVLENRYTEVTRPFSQDELSTMHNRVFRWLRIGTVRAHHRKCNHFYFVKENGKKAKEIEECGTSDIGNCSVCWKIHNTPQDLRDRARDLVDRYM